MRQHSSRLHGRHSGKITVEKPNTLSLLTRIFRATVLDGMQWPALFFIVLVSALYYFDIAHHESLIILTLTCILVIGLIRGCNAWQNDLNEYHHQLALARHQELDDEQRNVIPGYFPSRRY